MTKKRRVTTRKKDVDSVTNLSTSCVDDGDVFTRNIFFSHIDIVCYVSSKDDSPETEDYSRDMERKVWILEH